MGSWECQLHGETMQPHEHCPAHGETKLLLVPEAIFQDWNKKAWKPLILVQFLEKG